MPRNFKKNTTDKYTCRNCGCNEMYPNNNDGRIEGYACAVCKTVNYPVREKLGLLGPPHLPIPAIS